MAASTPRPRGPMRFLDFLRSRGGFTTDDALATLLPLFRQVHEVHAAGRVAPLEGVDELWVEDYRVYFEVARARDPRLATDRLLSVEERPGALEIVGQQVKTTEADDGREIHENLLLAKPGDEVKTPMYLPGYVSWEHKLGHHDALTDIYVLGLLLASVACGLDLTDKGHLETFAARRRNLFALLPHLNPVLARNIVRMTELGRHRRAQDLGNIIRSLETYRDQTVDLDLDFSRIPGFHDADLKSRRRAVLARLRERLFEISRRNRLLYYKPSLQNLNLTFASVPILFDPRSIRPEQLFTWQPEIEKLLVDSSSIPLNRYLRFEDAPYLPSVLDKLMSEARRDTAEFGFSQLRLVLCFLRWHDLKGNRGERIDSPLLLLPVELTKRKGVRDSYVMRATSREAEVNPVLRYYLKQIYGLNLPHAIDLSETTVQAFYETLVSQIQASEPGVAVERIDRPQVDVVYARARRRLEQYRRRAPLPTTSLRSFRDLDYSYKRDSYQPLGLRLFIGLVRPSPAPLHDVFRERPVHRPQMMVGPAPRGPEEKEKRVAAFRQGSGEGNPYSWDFDLCSLTLGNFNYRKMSLVRDYNTLLEEDQPNGPFDAIFSDAPRSTDLPVPSTGAGLSGRFPVVPCDPTQLRAIAAAESGASYIVQGPPGTGKSQTITNLIADLVGRGKRVLFVCEKRAAIDVVYHRLRQRGLHDLVCLIHDSQADKREFVMDLKNSYERLLARAGEEATDSETRRRLCVESLEREARPLARFHDAMRGVTEEGGIGLRQLIVRVIELKDRLPQLSPDEEDDLPSYRSWVEHREALDRLERALRIACPDGVYARHPLRCLSPAVAGRQRPRASLEEDFARWSVFSTASSPSAGSTGSGSAARTRLAVPCFGFATRRR